MSLTQRVKSVFNMARHSAFIRGMFIAFIGGGIFMFGVGVGSGRIEFGVSSIFRKSLQQNLPEDLDYSSVEKVYDTLRADFDGQLSKDKLLDGLMSGLVKAAGDPYTEYFNLEEAQDFNSELNGTFTGIGAELSKDDKNNIVIVSPISGFPAEKAGLKPKDIIAEINNETAYDLSVSQAVDKIRGPEGTNVSLKIVRGDSTVLDFTITRTKITIPSVEVKTLDGNIGYIKISRFSEDTTELVKNAASKFKTDKVKGMVLDLRGNPGGLLDVSVEVSGVWLPKGATVLTERRGGVAIKTYKSEGSATLKDIPTVVLIDEGSASASEITAGALKDNDVASLVGQKSFGKGSVQQLDLGALLKVTIARWYTPDGKNIDKEGIQPDKEVKISDEDIKNNRDPQLDAGLQLL